MQEDLKNLRKQDPDLAKKLQRKLKRKNAKKRAQVRGTGAVRHGSSGADRHKAGGATTGGESDVDTVDDEMQPPGVERAEQVGGEIEYIIETLEEEVRRLERSNKERRTRESKNPKFKSHDKDKSRKNKDDDEEDDDVRHSDGEAVDDDDGDAVPRGPIQELTEEFQKIFDRFQKNPEDEDLLAEEGEEESDAMRRLLGGSTSGKGDENDDDDDEEDDDGAPKLSKKALRALKRPTVSALKQSTRRPDVVEVWDTTSPNPYLQVHLKAYRNTVPVPVHWSHKRKYLQGKKGFEKPPFKLPDFIEATKISEIRQVIQERESQKTLKQKMREKVRPKMHKMDIDYQTLHDAFFKYATKPPLTSFGQIYYEGRELEVKLRKFKPGEVSDRLKEALGITTDTQPPPWLFNMQRYGPPPSYPLLPIPGLNAPIPPGAAYGFHQYGWGQPPTDAFGNPLFVTMAPEVATPYTGGEERLWGAMEDDEEDDEDAGGQSDDGEAGGDADMLGPDGEPVAREKPGQEGMRIVSGIATPASTVGGTLTPFEGMMQPGLRSVDSLGIGSISSGMETPDSVDPRRGAASTASSAATGRAKKAYTVLREEKAPHQPGALFSSSTIYKMPSASGGTATPTPGGATTPFGFAPGGTVTPLGLALGGAVTPLGGQATPVVGGAVTPAVGGRPGLTLALDPAQLEGGDVFAGDAIREQLKKHEDARERTLRAAGQIETSATAGAAKPKAAAVKKNKKKTKETFRF